MRRLISVLKYTLIALLALIIIVPAALYIPFVQTFVCNQVVAYLNDNHETMSFSVDKIRIGFPLKLKVYGVEARLKADDTMLLSIGKVQTALDDIPINKDYFLVKDFLVEDIALCFDTLTESIMLKGHIGQLEVNDLYLNLDKSQIDIDKVVVRDPDLSIAIGPSVPDSTEEDTPFAWTIDLKKILAVNGKAKFDMSDQCLLCALDSLQRSEYLDYNHLDLNRFNLGVEDFLYSAEVLSFNLSNFTVEENNSGLIVEHLSTDFQMQGNIIKAEDIALTLSDSKLNGDFSIDLALLDSLKDGYVSSHLDGAFATHELITLAAPYLPELENNWPEQKATFKADCFITPDTFQISELFLKIPEHTDFKITSFGTNPFSKEKRRIKASIVGDLTDADFLLTTFVAKPEERVYHLPKNLSADIDAQYNRQYAQAKFHLKQSGIVIADGFGKYNIDTEAYELNAQTDRLKLTEFVPMTGIDGLTSHIKTRGRHFEYPGRWTTLDIDLQLDTLLYNNGKGDRDSLYDVTLSASLNKAKYFVQISSWHPYLMLDAQLEGDFDKKNVSGQGYIDLQRIDLLHMPSIVAADMGQISLQSDIMCSYDYGDNAFADVLIHTMKYDDGAQIHPFDEIDLHLESYPGHLEAMFESGDASLELDADKSIASVLVSVDSILTEINHQIDITSVNVPAIQKHLPELHVELDVKRDNSFYPIARAMGYQFRQVKSTISNDSILSFQLRVLGLSTAEQHIDTVQIRFRPEHDKNIYDYKFHASYAAPKAHDSYNVDGKGAVYLDSISACFEYENGKYIKMYDVDASLAFAYDTLRLRFTDDPLIYAQKFTVNENNYIQVSNFKDLASQALGIESNLNLDNDRGLCVTLNTNKKDSVGNDVNLNISHLDLAYLSRALGLGIDMGGIVNAQSRIELLPSQFFADINSDISTFHIGDYRADTLLFKGIAGQDQGNLSIGGNLTIDNFVKLDILANVCDSVDVNVGIHELPLPLINGFMPGNIQFRGETSGNLVIKGEDFDHSLFNGFLAMHDASVNYADCDANIRFPNDTVNIRRNRLRFRDYKLSGANDRPVVMRGSVDFNESITDPAINLILSGEKVQIFNNSRRKNKNQYIYGVLPANVDMTIRGKVSDLDVNGSISALEGTNIVYYLEDDPLSSVSKVDELVDFVRFREVDRILPDRLDRPWKQAAKEEGVEVDLNLNIANNAKVYVNLPTNGKDHVTLIGGGSLHLTYEPDGSINMGGLYDISGGDVNYKLPMIPVTKDFALNDRSWISWNGDVADPNINLVAVENVKSAVNDQAGARVVNFEVTINITGTLNALDISFTCDAPDDGTISSELASLTDEERSKQALLLLIAQTYMGPGNTSSMGLASANAALNSILNKELESILTNKFKNTDINLGIDTYDADGAVRTDYSVKVSQRLFNDRMRVTVGGKISSGENAAEGQNDAMINDVSLEYLFKEDGSTFGRVFRKTNYQNVLEGEVIETGVGYVQQRSGFRFRNLLIPNNRKREAELRRQISERQAAERQEQMRGRRPAKVSEKTNRYLNDSILEKDSITAVVLDSLTVGSMQHNK